MMQGNRNVKGRRNKTPLEKEEQKMLVAWMRLKGIEFFSVPSEGQRTMKFVSRMKSNGWRPGIPDLILIDVAPKNKKPTAVEMKRISGGVVSEAQVNLFALMHKRGWNVIVAHGFEQAIFGLKELGYGN